MCKTWRHLQNRKYITYRNAVRRGPSQGDRQHAQKKISWSSAMWFSCYASRQTGRQTDRQTKKQTNSTYSSPYFALLSVRSKYLWIIYRAFTSHIRCHWKRTVSRRLLTAWLAVEAEKSVYVHCIVQHTAAVSDQHHFAWCAIWEIKRTVN